MNILIAGAAGFVGQALMERLLEEGHHVTALVRKDKGLKKKYPTVKFLEGDLLHPETLPKKMDQIQKAYYLVHGLKANEKDFEYEESVTAINFVNWLRPVSPGIIYLGGLSPHEEKLSTHLRSRNLTGAILAASGFPTTEFRASIILGEGSSSFEMIKALSERFPFRPELSLLDQPCQPLALSDLLTYLTQALELTHENHMIFEIGGPDIVNYGELLDQYAELAGLKRKILKIPEVDKKVLMKILDYAVPEHAEVGKKLVQSLEYPTVVTNGMAKKYFPDVELKELRVAMDLARSRSQTTYAPIWEKDFLKMLLSDKILTQSGLLSPELMKKVEKIAKLKDSILRK